MCVFFFQVNPVINGDRADRSIPWVALYIVYIRNTTGVSKSFCMSTLVTSGHLLTAGHCFCDEYIVNCTRRDKVRKKCLNNNFGTFHNSLAQKTIWLLYEIKTLSFLGTLLVVSLRLFYEKSKTLSIVCIVCIYCIVCLFNACNSMHGQTGGHWTHRVR